MGIIDYIIIALYMIAMVAIGFVAKGKIQTMDDFLLGGKRFNKLALTGTIVATMVGSGMTMGAVGNAYFNGATGTLLWMYFGFSVGLIVMGLISGRVRDTGTRSLAEMTGQAYGKTARLCMAVLVSFYAMAMVAINIAGLRTVIMNVFNVEASMLPLFTVIAAAIAILYTAVGGFYAVVWTDVIQFFLMIGGVFILGPIIGLSKSGGFAPVSQAFESIGSSFTNPLKNGITSSAIGIMLSYFLTSPGDPTMPQRALAAKDGKSAKFAFITSGCIGFYMGIALLIIGATAYVVMPEITDANSVLPQMILRQYPPVIKGLVIAGIISAIMSSFDSFLILGTTHIMYDIGQSVKADLKDDTIKKALPILTVVLGVVGIVIALFISSLFDFLYMVFSIMGSAVMPVMIAALYFRKQTSKFGAVASILVGALVPAVLYLTVGYNIFLGDPIFAGLIASIVALVLGSILVKDKKPVEAAE